MSKLLEIKFFNAAQMKKDNVSSSNFYFKDINKCILDEDLRIYYEETLTAHSKKKISLLKNLGLFTTFFQGGLAKSNSENRALICS